MSAPLDDVRLSLLTIAERALVDDVRRHADDARRSTAARDEAIVRMREAGFAQRAIAAAAGLSHTAVQHVLRRDAAVGRAEHEPCERGTNGCSVAHVGEEPCETW